MYVWVFSHKVFLPYVDILYQNLGFALTFLDPLNIWMYWLINPPEAFKPSWLRCGVVGEKFCFLGLCEWQPQQPRPWWYVCNIVGCGEGIVRAEESSHKPRSLLIFCGLWKAFLAFQISDRERNLHLGTFSCGFYCSPCLVKCINVPHFNDCSHSANIECLLCTRHTDDYIPR